MNEEVHIQKPEPLLAKNVNQGQHISYLPVEEKSRLNVMALVPAGSVAVLAVLIWAALLLVGA